MKNNDCAQFIIHKLQDGWRVEYRDLGSVHPSIDYPDDETMLAAIRANISEQP